MLGHGEDVVRLPSPTVCQIGSGICVRSVAVGRHHTLILGAGGQVYSCGRADDGVLGHPDFTRAGSPHFTPRRVEALAEVVVSAVAAGPQHIKKEAEQRSHSAADAPYAP